MKKILLLSLVSAAFAASAMAEEKNHTGLYLRGDIGVFINTPQKIGDKTEQMTLKASSPAASFDVGLGYNITDQFRGEVVYTHIFTSKINGSSGTFTHWDSNIRENWKAKGYIKAFMINGIFDAYDFGVGTLFCGGGAGLAQVSEKVFISTVEWAREESGERTYNNDYDKYKIKLKNNFAYNLMVGSSFRLLPDKVNLDIQYKWADYGKAKHKDDEIKIRRRGHNIKLGLRVNI